MAAHVEAHAGAEVLGSEEVLDHAHDGGALLVGDRVEVLGGLGDAAHLGIDRMCVGERVERERAGPVVLEPVPEPPLRPPVVDHAVGHPGGERLVQPEIVPPRHGDEVAVPHVRQLVGDHLGGSLALVERRGRWIEEEERLAEEHRARVLHRPGLEVGHGDEVELAVGVRDVEVVLETPERLGRRLEAELGEMAFARHVPDADRDRAEEPLGRRLERADGEGEEIGRERRRRGEVDDAPPGRVLLPLDRAVGDGPQPARHGDRQPEARLEGGFVEAGEDAARVGRLALAEGVVTAVGAGRVEAAEVLVEASGEAEDEPHLARRQRAREPKRDGLVGGVGAHAGRHLVAVEARRGALDPELGRVEDDLPARPFEPDRDLHLAAEAPGVEIDLEVDVVLARADVGGEAEARRPLGLRHGIAARLAGCGTACKSTTTPPPWSRPSAARRGPATLTGCST